MIWYNEVGEASIHINFEWGWLGWIDRWMDGWMDGWIDR